jgi:hypothetical protein
MAIGPQNYFRSRWIEARASSDVKRAQQPEDHYDDKNGADNAGTARHAITAIAKTAAAKQEQDKNDEQKHGNSLRVWEGNAAGRQEFHGAADTGLNQRRRMTASSTK